MRPAPHDFDVVTDDPRIEQRPQRRAPEPAEAAPQPDPEAERRRAAPEREQTQAAE